jgi:hypothetical protein
VTGGAKSRSPENDETLKVGIKWGAHMGFLLLVCRRIILSYLS